MSRTLKWIIAIVAGLGLIGLAVFAVIAGREEIAQERKREEPVKTPPRLSRGADGEVIVTLDRDTQTRIGLKVEAARTETIYPEVVAYGRLQEDPGASFVVRAPVAGTVRTADSRPWPQLGETLADGSSFGIIEPRLVPFERVDIGNRLTNAQADMEAAQASVDASRAAYERLKGLNVNKNVSDRAVQEAEARLKGDQARLEAARKNVAQLESAAKAQAGGAGPVSLTSRAGEVVDVFAHPNEAVESGQQILRIAQFDSMLARVDLPAGEIVDARISSARIVPVGHEDRETKGERVSLASTIDPRTLGEGFLFRVRGLGSLLRPGAALTAYLQAPGKPVAGVLIPQSAVVRAAGKTWVYRQIADDQFTRAEVSLDRSTSQGSIVTKGVSAGDRIVTIGPQILLSEEQKSQIQVLEDTESK
ncbi:MAG TPA: HlyD family efflux transporter periplasmic adaptor subunit [Candidatus Dormibacteraeota bacterium]|nr:HlyD family efflux transporter periplasmic adaptor subunit [Candidatus Dormibacteraeota bacterium]